MKIKLCFIALLCMAAWSCDAVRQVQGAYNMVNCKYDYNSVSSLSLAGINVSEGLSMANVMKVSALLAGGRPESIPLDMTINLDVSNPNQTEAMLSGLQYILSIDQVEFTTGSLSQSFNVPAGGKGMLPLSIGLDLAKLMTGDSGSAVTNIVKNLVGIGDQKSEVTLQIKPTFMVNAIPVSSPVYIPVSFSFGGK